MLDIYEIDLEKFTSYQALLKNNGLFKSLNHKKFLFDKAQKWNGTSEESEKYFNIKFNEDQKLICAEGVYTWADYGSRSKVPVLIFFKIDKHGVVTKYTVGGNGNLRDGWGPDPKKMKVVWERPESIELPEWEEPVYPEIKEGRYEIEGIIKSFKTVMNDFGISEKMLIEVNDGNKLFGTVPSKIKDSVEVGNKIKFTATVKPQDNGFAFYSRPSKPSII